MVVVSFGEYLVIRLPIVGREHHAKQGYGHFVTKEKRYTARPKLVTSHCRGRKMQKHARLSGIVRVVGVVDKAHMGFYPTPYLQLQAVVQPIKAIVQGIVKAVHARYFVATSCPVFKVSHVSRVRD